MLYTFSVLKSTYKWLTFPPHFLGILPQDDLAPVTFSPYQHSDIQKRRQPAQMGPCAFQAAERQGPSFRSQHVSNRQLLKERGTGEPKWKASVYFSQPWDSDQNHLWARVHSPCFTSIDSINHGFHEPGIENNIWIHGWESTDAEGQLYAWFCAFLYKALSILGLWYSQGVMWGVGTWTSPPKIPGDNYTGHWHSNSHLVQGSAVLSYKGVLQMIQNMLMVIIS